MIKKAISLIMSVFLIITAFSTVICAVSISVTAEDVIYKDTHLLVNSSALDDVINISADEARYIAELFVSDMALTGTCLWDENTEVIYTIPMYGEDGVSVSAYTVKLTEGYVVVSAFADVKSIIPEWSDSSEPIFDSFNRTAEKIIYLGLYNYYSEIDSGSVIDANGNIIEKSLLVNCIEGTRSLDNLPSELINSCRVSLTNKTVTYSYITDPYQDATAIYGGTFVNTEYYNEWGTYLDTSGYSFYTASDAPQYNNACGPVTITNIISAYEKRFPERRDIPDADTVMDMVVDYGEDHWKYINGNYTFYYRANLGTTPETIPYYVLDCLNAYDIPTNVLGMYSVNYEQLKYHLEEGTLLFMRLFNHPTYNSSSYGHDVMCYAYTRLRSETTGYYKTYLKIADGYSSSARYLDLADVIGNGEYTKVGLWG